jgi:hypothetical protein
LNSDNLNILNIWKDNLKAKKAGENLKPPYDNVRAYEAMPGEVKLLFDALSDVIDALTEEEK